MVSERQREMFHLTQLPEINSQIGVRIERSADGVNTTEKERRLKLSWNKKNDSEVLINKIPFSFFLQLRLNEIIHEHFFSVSHSFSDNTITCLPIQTVRAFCLASLFPVNFLFIFLLACISLKNAHLLLTREGKNEDTAAYIVSS